MSNRVYANDREVSCKAGAGKSIAAFPDVCFTPPQTPATPPGVPIPYPNTGMTSDTSDGEQDGPDQRQGSDVEGLVCLQKEHRGRGRVRPQEECHHQ